MRKFCCDNCRCCVGFGGSATRICKATGDYISPEQAKEYCCKDFVMIGLDWGVKL